MSELPNLEPLTFWMPSSNFTDATGEGKALTPTPSDACTSACTSEGENANADALDTASLGTSPQAADAYQGDPLARLATALLTLSPADRAKLAAMVTGIERQQG